MTIETASASLHDQVTLDTEHGPPPGNADSWSDDDTGVRGEPLDLQSALAAARTSGRYLVAVWRVADDKVHLYREIDAFPLADLPIAFDLLVNDIQPLIEAEA